MGDERDGEETEAAGTAGAPPKDTPEPGDATGAGLIDGLRDKVAAAASELLRVRRGLEEAPGSPELPDRGLFEELGQRADELLRGFFRGFVDGAPPERHPQDTAGAAPDAPNATEVVGRVLGKVSDTVSGTFHQYLKEHAVDPGKPEEPVVVDGRFIFRHGAPLLASFVHALGTRLTPEAPNEPADAPAQEPTAAPRPHVDYRVDVPSLFRSLFVRPSGDTGDKS